MAHPTAASTGDVWREATLYRDEWGVPHVYAETPFAMAFVFGYAQAEDHAEHLLLAYRMANGRLASILGEAYADSDAFSLKMGHARLAEAALPTLDPVTRALCEGFAMGINAWLVDHPDSAPAWAEGVQPRDILAFWHAFLMSMAPFDLPDIHRRPPAMVSGNAWATSPERNRNGSAILVINPHQHHDGFFQWYEAHLVLGRMNLYGATLRGLPVIVQGHNERLGWALTPNQPDFADVFREDHEPDTRRNPNDPRVRPDDGMERHALLLHYMSHSLPYHVRTPEGLETRYVPAYIGERGPIFEHPALGLHSWFIGGYNDFGGLRQLLEMGFSQTLNQFTAALSMQQIPCFHVVYADQDGNIFYLYNTKSGLRVDNVPAQPGQNQAAISYRWDEPLPYSLAPVAWRAVFSLNELPHVLNPPSGFVQACGNPPWTTTAPTALDPSLWPDWFARDRDTYRARRVRQLLYQGERTFRNHQSMLFDVVAPAAFDLVPALMQTIEMRPDIAREMHPDFWTGVEILREWNYTADTFSEGMTFFHLWWTLFSTRAGRHGFANEQQVYAAVARGAPEAQEAMLQALEGAARTLRNEYGALEMPWGDIHRIQRGKREAPLPGASSGEPIFVASDYRYDQGKFKVNYGYGFAMVAAFGAPVESVSFLPFGVSQNPQSPHFDDQLDLMLERRFKRVRFHHDDILRNAVRGLGKSVTLLPQGVTGAVSLHGQGILHARLTSAVEPPYPIPDGMLPFSLYVHPERRPLGAPVEVEVSIHIPDVLCEDAYFSRLRLYRHEPGLDWHPAPMQTLDANSRILYMRDDAIAEWYVVLGPAEAAVLTEEDELYAAPTISGPGAQTGLEALLNPHTVQPAVSGRGRLFRLERHDIESSDPLPEWVEETTPTEQDDGRTFKLERHDAPEKSETETATRPMLNVPGFHFGPAARSAQDQQSIPRERVFHMERLDKPDESTETSVEHPRAAEDDPALSQPEAREVESDSPIPAELPQSTPEPEAPAPVERRERPPLPDVIPQDPAFIFIPSQQREAEIQQPRDQGTFNIERHE